ncbi:hypothetical protein [Sphaerotilus microaerophilus]|uniref:Uncharacterized protein n=1 Tax=Sphaerotilus microaerophilus TaxID=2914710 RepID=A0ABN6PRH9_9BURK|nr:hypothetical protein [Sphaerotilus sp. FB-5]BDI06688.1 hypothetical protein CATMQ487_36580 [Sphaerotilus sp. FB-5]
MFDLQSAVGSQTDRQVAHWVLAAWRLNLDDLASQEAWSHLEQYLGISLRRHLQGTIDSLMSDARVLTTMNDEARSPTARAEVRHRLLAFRRQYLRSETTLDFFADAIGVRTNRHIAGLLRACDTLAHRSMAQLLDQLGKTAPVALTYLDKGLGASILKAGLRLWDGGKACPVAVIKVTRHNLLRPTALIHEAGHQVAHITHWNDELTAVLATGLRQAGAKGELAEIWAGWASEIAADGFAFAHTGFASLAALHDVLAGDQSMVFRFSPGDPHPISYLRVLLGAAMCRHCYGEGPWDALALSWTDLHPLQNAPTETRAIVADSMPLLNAVVRLVLDAPMRAFAGRPLRALIPPERVSPAALNELDSTIGPALFTSAHWLWTEPLRILSLTGLQLAVRPHDVKAILERQEQAMLRLGGALQTA